MIQTDELTLYFFEALLRLFFFEDFRLKLCGGSGDDVLFKDLEDATGDFGRELFRFEVLGLRPTLRIDISLAFRTYFMDITHYTLFSGCFEN